MVIKIVLEIVCVQHSTAWKYWGWSEEASHQCLTFLQFHSINCESLKTGFSSDWNIKVQNNLRKDQQKGQISTLVSLCSVNVRKHYESECQWSLSEHRVKSQTSLSKASQVVLPQKPRKSLPLVHFSPFREKNKLAHLMTQCINTFDKRPAKTPCNLGFNTISQKYLFIILNAVSDFAG